MRWASLIGMERLQFGFRRPLMPPVPSRTAGGSRKVDGSLPRLPVPPLQATLDKYLKSVRPYLDADEYSATERVVREFGRPGGVGTELQASLLRRAAERESWLAEWWLHSAYLDFRAPVVVHSSPGHVWPPRRFLAPDDQLRHAARTIVAAVDFKRLVDGGLLPQDWAGGEPLDMSQYGKVLGACRVPGPERDELRFGDSRFVTVIRNGHIFVAPAIGRDGIPLDEGQVLSLLREAAEMSSEPHRLPVGALTSENRDVWGRVHRLLERDGDNAEHLRAVRESLFAVCLDARVGPEPSTRSGWQNLGAARTVHGGGGINASNRWYDKTVQFVVGEDGVNGMTYEHSPAEGQPVAALSDHVLKSLDADRPSRGPPSRSFERVRRLDFGVSPEVGRAIREAEVNVGRLAADLQFSCFTFDAYGKEFIKSHGLSPDSYVQMAIQLAFYRLHRVPGAHYETASTRKYAHGRTETVRSCSEESVLFARTVLDGRATSAEKAGALRTAVEAHKRYAKEASDGHGVDRHLLGLKLTALESGRPLPALYTDPGFVRSAHMRISTSQVASRYDTFMCFGPLVPDGYATCYNPRAHDIVISNSAFVACRETDADKYRAALEDSLLDMRDALVKSTKSKL